MATVNIIPSTTYIENNEVGIYFVWDEAVTGFATTDITVSDGTKGDFTGSNGVYRLDYTPPVAQGDITITVAANAVTETNTETTFTLTYGQSRSTASLLPNDIDGSAIAYTAQWIYTLGLQPIQPNLLRTYAELRRYTHTGVEAGVSNRIQLSPYIRDEPRLQSLAIFNDRFVVDDICLLYTSPSPRD